MITTRILEEWYPRSVSSWLEDCPEFLKIAEKLCKEDYENWLDDLDEDVTPCEKSFLSYAQDELYDEGELIIDVLNVYRKLRGYKAVIIEAYEGEHEDWWTVRLVRIIPETTEDLCELAEVYMKEHDLPSNLAELVVDRLTREL